jgi:AcrR family transcriptional regulator
MPRITDERRKARREQVLEAARACLQEHGLEAVSMEMIIARSGLSTGAVYGYFKGKDDIISAVVTEGTAALGRQLVPVLKDPEPRPLPELMEQLLRTIADFGQDKHDGIDRLLVALHGWSHSQSDPGLKAATRAAYRNQRGLLADTVRRWQAAGTLDPGADPEGVAQLLQSIILGFAAQRALAGDADVQAHASALDALTKTMPGGPGAGPGGTRALKPAAPPSPPGHAGPGARTPPASGARRRNAIRDAQGGRGSTRD